MDDNLLCVISDFGQSEMKSEACKISGNQPPRSSPFPPSLSSHLCTRIVIRWYHTLGITRTHGGAKSDHTRERCLCICNLVYRDPVYGPFTLASHGRRCCPAFRAKYTLPPTSPHFIKLILLLTFRGQYSPHHT